MAKYIVGGAVTPNEKIMFLDDGSIWERIFWHDVSTDPTMFADADEAEYCDNATNRYSNLRNIWRYQKLNGKYEFMLRYPSRSKFEYNRWEQNVDPRDTTADANQSVDSMGYVPIHIDWATQWKFGMGLSSSSNAYIDCEAGHSNWYGAIGQYTLFRGGFPAPRRTRS